MAQFLFITDLDNTLVGDDHALETLNQRLIRHRETHGTKIVYSTGRSLTSYQNLCTEKQLLPPDALITGVGTAIYHDLDNEPDSTWSELLMENWDRDRAAVIAAQFAELTPQPESEQGRFKASYYLSEADAEQVLPQLKANLHNEGLQFSLIYSGGKDLDILPHNANKGLAMTFLREQWQFGATQTVACGDSGNDRALFDMGDEHGIIVGNAMPELLEWHYDNPSPRRYLAKATYAAGILEGLTHFKFI
ncbi:MAG TPA: sucrose-phosphate phosphatase [Crinalium sp.]